MSHCHSRSSAALPAARGLKAGGGLVVQGLILWSPASMNPLQWTYFSPIILRGPGVSLRCSVILSQGLG